ncbi:MAG: sigma 54-interacting transcriptional regulator [Candidatus Aureabacteria bacterium]|nr:sigma 54-interacting transcriptional regulator [Candidatus Auribacterota bacterium]
MNPSIAQPPVRREVKELRLLFEVSQILDRSMDLNEVAVPMLKAMADHMGMLRGTLTLLNRGSGEISIEAAYGLSASQQERGRYRVGEGVTGKVVQSGRPAVVPRISEEPLFLNRTGALARAVRLRRSAQEERERLLGENIRLQKELADRFRPSNIIGNSRAMQAVYDLIAQVSSSDATALISGESGTGKELVAHAIHYNSRRAERPFIKVSCAALPETVVESELFGHEKGAFTGAVIRRKGRFELAHGGTLFLDEIGDLSPSTQIKLLRVLQENEFERVGGMETIKVDVRLIAATNRNLETLIAEGKFRADLYYRLNVFPIRLPPLKERRTDILLLADHFAEKYCRENRKVIKRISTPALDVLLGYHWPGNVRELENCIERAVLLSTDEVIHSHHLPPTVINAEASNTPPQGPLQGRLAAMEKEMLLDALKSSRGNMARSARFLGLSERIMGLRVGKYGINPKKYRL